MKKWKSKRFKPILCPFKARKTSILMYEAGFPGPVNAALLYA